MDAVLHRVSSPTFVGRADELASLEAALDRAAAGVPAFTFVAGESGVGKSRLLSEFESRAADTGARVFLGHCLELGGTSIPYAPLVDALRPIARELADRCSDLPESLPSGTRAALAELLCVVVTYRSDELHRRHPLRPLLAELERTPGVERLGLERFSRDEMVAQVSAILGEPPGDDLA